MLHAAMPLEARAPVALQLNIIGLSSRLPRWSSLVDGFGLVVCTPRAHTHSVAISETLPSCVLPTKAPKLLAHFS